MTENSLEQNQSNLAELEKEKVIWERIHKHAKEALYTPRHSENCMCRDCTGEYH